MGGGGDYEGVASKMRTGCYIERQVTPSSINYDFQKRTG